MRTKFALIIAMLTSLLSIGFVNSPATADQFDVTYNPRLSPCNYNPTGPSIQAVYFYNSDEGNDFTTHAAEIRLTMREANGMLYDQSGGARQFKFVTYSNCSLSVLVYPATPAQLTYGIPIAHLKSIGLNARNRAYLVFQDDPKVAGLCGGTNSDDSSITISGPWKSKENPDNVGPSWSRIFPNSLNGRCRSGETVAHELLHAFGAVSRFAPHADDSGHADDWYDLMDSDDTLIYPFPCANPAPNPLPIDCKKDDYFNLNPPIGNYLRTHWNTADSAFMWGGGPAASATQAPWEPAEVEAQAMPSYFEDCGNVTVGWDTWDASAIAGHRVQLLDASNNQVVETQYMQWTTQTPGTAFEDLVNGKSYKVKVTAVNSLGTATTISNTVTVPINCI